MLIENRVVTALILDDNPVGKRGGRAILRALRSIVLFKMQRSISLRNCNFDYQSKQHLFDPSEPGGATTNQPVVFDVLEPVLADHSLSRACLGRSQFVPSLSWHLLVPHYYRTTHCVANGSDALPRQARDKHTESIHTMTKRVFCAGEQGAWLAR